MKYEALGGHNGEDVSLKKAEGDWELRAELAVQTEIERLKAELARAKGEIRHWDIRHWYIHKPIAHNCPLRSNGVVFTEFQPTVSEQNCEWIRVYSADDIQKKIGMGLTRYCEVLTELQSVKDIAVSYGAMLLEFADRHDDDQDELAKRIRAALDVSSKPQNSDTSDEHVAGGDKDGGET